jgi:hypothetical protein
MTFGKSGIIDFLKTHNFIPEEYLKTGIFDSHGYVIAACSTLRISKCYEYLNSLSLTDDQIADFFPAGAGILPQPASQAEEDVRREELQNTIAYMKGRAGVIFQRKCKDGHLVNLKVRVELDELDIRFGLV